MSNKGARLHGAFADMAALQVLLEASGRDVRDYSQQDGAG